MATRPIVISRYSRRILGLYSFLFNTINVRCKVSSTMECQLVQTQRRTGRSSPVSSLGSIW